MITERKFKEGFCYLELNFNLKFESADLKHKYLKFVFKKTKDSFDNVDIEYGFIEMIKMTQAEWNKEYGYNGKPSIQDWVNFFSLRSKHNVLKEKDQKIAIAVNNAKNGIYTKKNITHKNTVSSDKIKETINNLMNNLTLN